MYALSLKQPWATLLAHGVKSIEIRRWPTTRRGRILIHAAKVSDDRPEVWARVPEPLRQEAHLVGGLVGAGDLMQCVGYRTREAFARDQPLHLNELDWFEPPILYGFVFTNLAPMTFHRCPGWMRFFEVQLPPPDQ